jgi:acetyl esterase/lipase
MVNQMTDEPITHYAVAGAPPPADTAHIKRKFLNVPYAGLSRAQQLDIYLPDAGDDLFPVIVLIHGGAFMGCDKADLHVVPALEGLKRGYAVVSLNYRMSGEAKFPALVQDVKAALRWVRAHAPEYKLDAQKVAAWGTSAGAYLASMLGVSYGIAALDDLSLGHADQPSTVQAVVALYGPTNFLKMDEHLAANGLLPPPGFRHSEANSPESLLLGRTITEVPDLVRDANPETYIRPGFPPFLLQHGLKDATVPVLQSIEFAEKLKHVAADRVTLELIEGAEHADPTFERSENVSRILDFLDEHLKRS